jgi:hypothetical protein
VLIDIKIYVILYKFELCFILWDVTLSVAFCYILSVSDVTVQ